ncbi:MAG: hypothetical protein JWM38_2586 [Sphingomonas bacterium]|nr:hypothetical protein [Sphingomonas bacterium]MDB5719159.1 hypothetical protein [Sphingomonas bacterium]
MDGQRKDSGEPETLGALFARLIDDGANLFRAELNLYRQGALRRAARAKTPVIMVVAAVLLVQSSVTTMLVGLALGLARWLGPVGGGLAAALVGLIAAAILLKMAMARFKDALSEANEKDADAVKERIVADRIEEQAS